jgi:hypothetical protein
VASVVQGDGNDIANAGDRRPEPRGAFDQRQRSRFETSQAVELAGGQRFAVNISHPAHQAAKPTLIVEEARPFGAGRSIA